ncbi:MAG: transposase [Selenomonadaceae bacterium]|nr:transposase [Selenomonadaceae bacterium]
MNVILTGGQIRFFIAEHGAFACIPDKANFKIKHDFDSQQYKQRNIVERFFQRIKNYRHIATRYDKLALCFENFVLLAACVIHF